jgi:hypothetical protein
MRRTPRLLTLVIGALLAMAAAALGCASGGGHVQRGINCYRAANYPCAAAVFQEIEAAGYQLNPKGRVRFLAYRGLTHLQLRQDAFARAYLEQANAAYRSGDPSWLPPAVVAEMDQALATTAGGSQLGSPLR